MFAPGIGLNPYLFSMVMDEETKEMQGGRPR